MSMLVDSAPRWLFLTLPLGGRSSFFSVSAYFKFCIDPSVMYNVVLAAESLKLTLLVSYTEILWLLDCKGGTKTPLGGVNTLLYYLLLL